METIQVIKKQDYVIVQLHRGKVNAINHQMVKELRAVVKEVSEDEGARGMILTGTPHFFSAGLDVIELYSYDEQQIQDFFIDFGSLHIDLVRFWKPMVCAITGHSPAGGCVLAIAADYRIMAEGEKYSIGLNEVAVNIQISQNLVNGYGFWLGAGRASRYLLEGKLLSVREALEEGLVQETCPLSDVLARAEEKMQHYLRADATIFQSTKQKVRKMWLEGLSDDGAEDLREAYDTWWRPDIRARMKMFVESLQKK